jgi:DNA-binding transcriptional LysR family regulator
MDRLSEMEAFVRVVELGGFTDAARKLDISKSAVSKHVAALEARLGARLLNRTTRRVNPTEIGLAYYDRAARILADASEADAMAGAMQDKPRANCASPARSPSACAIWRPRWRIFSTPGRTSRPA